MRLQDKVAIITGAARGIGRASVELFAAEGAVVYAADIALPDPLPQSDNVRWVQHDVTSDAAWASLVERIVAEENRIDVLMNNAGMVGSYENIDQISLEDWNRVLDLNLNGTFLGVRHVVPAMKRQQSGSIINVSSIWGISGAAGVAAYTASKGAVRLLSKNVALSFASDGIRSNSLHPGIISTPMIDAQDADVTAAVVGQTPIGRLGRPEEIAFGALFLASDESSYMTGAELVIDGGYTTQ
jgi:Dehydrogenases with different specificities (related to short-chain alcohol dehydrogenases)